MAAQSPFTLLVFNYIQSERVCYLSRYSLETNLASYLSVYRHSIPVSEVWRRLHYVESCCAGYTADTVYTFVRIWHFNHYHAMHYRSRRLSVRLSVCNIGGS